MGVEGETFTTDQTTMSGMASGARLLGLDYSTLLQILITYALLLGQVETVPVGGELRTPPPYIKATTPTGKKFDIGLFGVRTA